MASINYTSTDEFISSYEPIPAGTYLAVITESEVKETSSGNGIGISLKFQIMEGEYAGRTVFEWINYQHQNQQAEKIGRKVLNTIMAACGFAVGDTLNDTNQLHGIAMLIDVKLGKDRDGEPRNVIEGYAPVDEEGSDAPVQAEAPAKNSGQKKKPWER